MDEIYMKRAIELSKKGIGFTSPNPLVGAVIVKDGRIIGEGYHQVYGGFHAEVNAFLDALEDVSGSTMYVTLEPCSHFGKTPPCANLIVEKDVKKVVVGLIDPNPLVAGKGVKILQSHGIEVKIGVLENECRKLNEIFLKYITTSIPYCILKTAMTLDGKIATYTGHSKYITNELSREFVHTLRHQVSGIIVGINTVICDNPLLTTRLENKRDPIRIIVDSEARIPLEANVLNLISDAKTIIATTKKAPKEKIDKIKEKGAEIIVTPIIDNRVDLNYLMKELGKRKIDSVLLEGGSTLNYFALESSIVDKIYAFIAPKIIGGDKAKTPVGGYGKKTINEAINIDDINIHHFNEDIMIEGYIRKDE